MILCGVDEVGRGPLAGPVVAAAVILPDGFPRHRLRDSKRLSDSQRRLLDKEIRANSTWSIGEASVEEIDSLNIHQATLLAMERAVLSLSRLPDKVLVDGLFAPPLPIPAESVVRGDATVPEIMAASIVAKVFRDDLMVRLSLLYPHYGLAKHKGYPTLEHRRALMLWGPSPIHRKSFRWICPSETPPLVENF